MKTTSTGQLCQALGFWINFDLVWCLCLQCEFYCLRIMPLLTSDRIAFIYFKVLLIFLFSFLPILVVPIVKFLSYSATDVFVSLHCPIVLSSVQFAFLCFFNGSATIFALFLLYTTLVIGNVLHFWQQKLNKKFQKAVCG